MLVCGTIHQLVPNMQDKKFVSRGGLKLEHALKEFAVNVTDMVVLDIGSSTGGFVDCLLQNGAAKVYSLDTAYGELAWKLRQDPRVVVIERQNILFYDSLPEKVDLVTIDVTFTHLDKILVKVKDFIKDNAKVIALLKPQYEDSKLAMHNKGVIPEEQRQALVATIVSNIQDKGWQLLSKTVSPITGKDGNTEYLLYLAPTRPSTE